MEETQRQNLMTAFNNVLRTSTLVGTVDVQRSSLAFAALLQSTPEGPVPLQALYEFFLEQKASEPKVREIILFMKSREARFGVTFDLPSKLQHLSAEEQAAIVTAFTSRGASSGTTAGRGPESTNSGGRTSTPSADGPRTKAENPAGPRRGRNAGPAMSQTRKLVIGLGVMCLALVVNLVVTQMTATPPPKPVILTDPAGLPCVVPLGSASGVICKLPKAFLAANTEETLAARGAITRAAAKSQGYNKVLVMGLEDGRLKWVF